MDHLLWHCPCFQSKREEVDEELAKIWGEKENRWPLVVWVVVAGAGAGPAPLTGGGPMPVATSRSVAGGRRLGRAPSVPEATATATTTVAGGRPKIFPRGTFPGRPQPPGLAHQL